jgi:hypothetical protein
MENGWRVLKVISFQALSTSLPCSAKAAAKLTVVVVLALPPFLLLIAIALMADDPSIFKAL